MKSSNQQLREIALQRQLRKYAWWLSNNGRIFTKTANSLGWRGSRVALRWAGRPAGALAWPMGLGLLTLNAANSSRTFWLNETQRFLPSILDLLEEETQLHIDRGGILYAALGIHDRERSATNYLERVTSLVDPLLHRTGAQDGKVSYTEGRDEILVDTLGMICPVLARLTRISRKDCYEDLAFAQLEAFRNSAIDKKTGWIRHAFHRKTGELLGPAGWGRGVAWYFLALVDTALEMAPGHRREILIQLATELKNKLAITQRSDGHWPVMLTDINSHLDSSVTGMVAYSLARLADSDLSRPRDMPCSILRKALAALDSSTDKYGRINFASGEAHGIGDYNSKFGPYIWSQGPGTAAELCTKVM